MPKSGSWFFYLCALEGAAAIAALFLIPSEGGRLSLTRLALIGSIALLCIGWVYLGRAEGSQVYTYISNHAGRLRGYLYTCVLASLILGLSLFLLRYLDPESSLSTYERLSPLLWYLLLLSVQFFFFFLVVQNGIHLAHIASYKPTFVGALVALCLLLAVFFFISLTRLGITPDPAYWGEPGVPILGWQFAIALIAGVGALCLSFSVRTRLLGAFLPVLVYLFALVLWLGVPADVLANSFYMPINPPDFQPFPYSDAGYYDQMAQSLLIGHPYQGTIPTRPLYIFLLTVLHLLFGEHYRNIITGQTAVLALIPVALYFLGKKLHSRIAGVTIASFFIFRELTALLVSSDTRVSNTKMLLVDLPTLLLLILACLFAVRWLERKTQKDALIGGGMFGLLLLLRTQSLVILPLILLIAFLVLGWKSRPVYLLTFCFLLGLLITIIPWLTHNYLRTGQFTFDAPFQYKVIASQYAYSGNLDIENYDFQGKGLGSVLLEFALKDPGFVFGFISNHFLATQIHGLLALPLIKPFNGIFEPINLYWMDWQGQLEGYNLLLILIYLMMIALGLGAAWRRWRWIGLVPLAFSLGYALATAIGRFSGWRYDLPADWIWYFYFGVGFAELLMRAASLFGAEEQELARAYLTHGGERSDNRERSWRGGMQSKRQLPVLAFTLLIFALLGALPWLAESLASARFVNQSQELLLAETSSLSAQSSDEINAFARQGKTFIQTGRLLYPRFFSKDDGLASANPWPAYAVRDYPRLGFLLLNQSSFFVVFRTKRLAEFPHAQDAIVIGCQRDGYVEARWIAFPELNLLYAGEDIEELPATCSP